MPGRSDPWILVSHGSLRLRARVKLAHEESKHLVRVLRRRSGDTIVLADGCGVVASARLVDDTGRSVCAEVEGLERVPRPSAAATLVLAVLHTKAMDWAVQKAVELGAGEVVPVLCDRSQGDIRQASRRLGHWRKTAEQALKQCRRPWAMPVREVLRFDEWLDGVPEPGLYGDAAGIPPDQAQASRPPCLLIGPEGGLTTEETDRLNLAAWMPVCFGPHVLRSETAAVAGLAILATRPAAAVSGDPVRDRLAEDCAADRVHSRR